MSEKERGKLEWSDLKTFVDETTGLAIRLQQGLGTGRPQYSAEIGRVREGKFLRFQRVQYNTDAGNVAVQPLLDFDVLEGLADQVRRFVEDTQQKREEEFAQRRQQQNERGGGRPRKRVGTHGRYDGEDDWGRRN